MTNDTIIEALVYPEASPTLINVGEVSYLFWLHDAGDQRTSENRTALVYATSTDQRNWSAPIQVIPEIRDLDGTSLSTGELEYSLVVNNDEIHIILQKCNRVLGADITLDDLAKASDIYMVTIGRDSSAVSGSAIKSIIEDDITGVPQGSIMQDSGIAAASGSAVFITNITNFDDNAQVMPRIASDGSTVTLAWITNSMTSPGGLFGHDNTYHINYVDINDLNNIQRVQLPNGSVIAFMDIGIINNKTVIAYVLDRDGDYSTEDDRVFYIMETGSNSILMQFDEAVYNPQFIKLGNQYILAWYYNGDILYTSDLVNIQTIFGEMETDVNSSFSIISGSNGEVLLIWEATSAERGNVVFRASRYNNSNGVWSRPYNLYQTNSETTSKFDGFISQMGNPVLAYIERHSDINNLVVSNVTPKNDVSLISVGYDDDQLKRGEMLPLTLVVENTGNNIVSFLDVYVDGNSAPFANLNSLNINPGETEIILVNGYVVPELLDGVEQVDINIKAYGEDNFTDNAYVMDIGYTDLSVSAEKFFMNGHNWARITVNNNSDIPSDGVLRIIADEPDGAVLYEEAFTNLTKDANLVTLSNLDTILGETIIDVFYIMVVPYAEELRTGNNTALLYLGLGREARSVQKYNVYYASNEAASGIAPTSMDYYPNEEFVLPRNTFVRVGYTFNGWSDGSRTYQEGATYVMPSRNVQFYAIWTGEDSDTPSTPGPGSSQTPAPTKDDSDKDEDIFTIDIKEFEKYIKRNKDGSLTLLIEGKDLIDLIKNDKSNTTRISLVIGSDDLSDDQLRDLSIILSKELLNAIRETGKDIIVSIEDEKNKAIYQWYFDGESLKNSKKKIDDINLALYVSSVNQNSNIQGLIDNMPNRGRQEQGYVVSFMHDGALPIVCDVRLYLGENSSFKEGDTFILYHYNPKTGKFETLPYSTYTIDKNGYITIRISHCSDYVLFPEAVSSRLITSLRNQISISSSDKTLYLSDVDNKANIQINSPEHLVEVKEISEMDKESGVGVYTVKYKSSNDKVAVVNEKGEITAKGKGTCIITTTVTLYSGKVKTVETLITVKNPYIKLVNKSSEMKTGERFTFTAKGYGIDTDDIEWTTSKRSIVVINKKSGKATAKSAGTDYVIAKHGDYEVRYKVVVK
ncbi:MAG: InlB B-repeat-containing protein [Clostridiales bacterium]|nr:InlB B-repeat-containing protein [Clostridiales bacterium]